MKGDATQHFVYGSSWWHKAPYMLYKKFGQLVLGFWTKRDGRKRSAGTQSLARPCSTHFIPFFVDLSFCFWMILSCRPCSEGQSYSMKQSCSLQNLRYHFCQAMHFQHIIWQGNAYFSPFCVTAMKWLSCWPHYTTSLPFVSLVTAVISQQSFTILCHGSQSQSKCIDGGPW